MGRLVLLGLGLSWVLGCASTGGNSGGGVPREDRFFLLRPTEGFSMSIDSSTRGRLEAAHVRLVESGDARPASEVAAELLGRNPDLAPARVLRAQVLYVDGQFAQVLNELLPIVGSEPSYTAAQMLYGRASERMGNLVEALEAYRAVSAKSPLARSRALDIEARASEILAHRIEDALSRGDPVAAAAELARLQQLAPDSDLLPKLAAEVARVLDDPEVELQALRRLSRQHPGDLRALLRRAELELEIGDPAAGLRLLEEAATERPEDRELADALKRARFLWRLQLLPPEARELAQMSELDRADLATLLFWLFPEIRYGRGGDAIIANDVLEHPRREQIVKVANAGVMDVDPNLHRFEPYRTAYRSEALTASLRILAHQEPISACLPGRSVPLSSQEVCRVAALCGLIEGIDDCQPTMPLSGPETMEISRLTQELLSGN